MARRQRDRSLIRPIGAQCRITMNLLPCALRWAQEPCFPSTLRHPTAAKVPLFFLFAFPKTGGLPSKRQGAVMFSQSFRPVCLFASLPVGKGVIRFLGLECVARTQRPAVAIVATPTHQPCP